MVKNPPRYGLLTFQSPIRHCRQLRNRITTFVIVIAFDDCIDIIIKRRHFIGLGIGLRFAGEAIQYHGFDAHLIFEQSDQFNLATQYV